MNGESFLTEGDFLLRTPLPSGILLKSEPKKNSTIYIPNTIKALGFQKTIILSAMDAVSLPLNEYGYRYFITGIFYIPTQEGSNLKWLKLIPNATAILDSLAMHSQDGKINKVFMNSKV